MRAICREFPVGLCVSGIDGEALELPTPLRFQIHPGGLRMLVPEGNAELSLRRQAHDVVWGTSSGWREGSEEDGRAGDQNGCVCAKRTGSFVRSTVPSSLLPGVVTTTTASLPVGWPSGFITVPFVKVPV